MKSKAFLVLLLVLGFTSSLALLEIKDEAEWKQMHSDDKVWLVKFYSEMCGACQEYEPVWLEIVDEMKGQVSAAKVNIDNEGGLNLAMRLGVLDEMVPNVRLVHSRGSEGVGLVKGEALPKAKVIQQANNLLMSHAKNQDGSLIKSA
eukprot:CAMPEP_0113933590 /NCGR_PEP_ID=MMETSP1339-20121228/735_1 /TAXON_ID=94617 /ORGANISM="Fibrocapsa japonica" /LENGTH=146 /DNA_ID=CAMNT_0000934927 /DNA_START=95 /DNA_END=535 /DNA_ORIENTATION=+ /assembly_acc=CAM_ASM_000762